MSQSITSILRSYISVIPLHVVMHIIGNTLCPWLLHPRQQGTIPPQLFSFLGALSYIDLSENSLSGTLPNSVGWASRPFLYHLIWPPCPWRSSLGDMSWCDNMVTRFFADWQTLWSSWIFLVSLYWWDMKSTCTHLYIFGPKWCCMNPFRLALYRTTSLMYLDSHHTISAFPTRPCPAVAQISQKQLERELGTRPCMPWSDLAIYLSKWSND